MTLFLGGYYVLESRNPVSGLTLFRQSVVDVIQLKSKLVGEAARVVRCLCFCWVKKERKQKKKEKEKKRSYFHLFLLL